MDRTRRTLTLVALAGATALAKPAAACEPDAMDAHLTAVCEAALAPAKAALDAAMRLARPYELAAIERALAVAGEACATGDPAAGARIAANLARIAGRIEGRAGLSPADLDARA